VETLRQNLGSESARGDGKKVPPHRLTQVLILGPGLTANALLERFSKEPHLSAVLETEVGDRRRSLRPFQPGSVLSLKEKIQSWMSLHPDHQGPFWVHPGITSWSERPDFPGICQEMGAIGISSSARSLARISDRLHLLLHAETLGIEVLLMHRDPFLSSREVDRWVSRSRVPFPFVLKSVHGSGPFSMIDIRDAEDLERRLPLWTEQLRKQTGEVLLFVERVIEGARIISLPFARSHSGALKFFSTVDSSIRSRHRRILEFSPAQVGEVHQRLKESVRTLLSSMNFVGLGLVEFLVDGERVFLVNVLPRISSSFSIWEESDAPSALDWQLWSLGLKDLSSLPNTDSAEVPSDLFHLSARILAEDSLLQLPQPGWIRECAPPALPTPPFGTARIRWAVSSQQDLSSERSGLLGVLEVSAESRGKLLELARWGLQKLWVAGSIQTNERMLTEILEHPWVREGAFHAGFIDEEFVPQLRPSEMITGRMAGLCAYLAGTTEELKSLRWVSQDQWVTPLRDWEFCDSEGQRLSQPPEVWTLPGSEGSHGDAPVGDALVGISGWIIDTDQRVHRFCVSPIRPGKWLVRMENWFQTVRFVKAKPTASGTSSKPRLLALVSGKIHAILYPVGVDVPAHEPVVIIESLGQLIPHAIPRNCAISDWKIKKEVRVKAGEVLADIDIHSVAGTK
jgi:acetyl/propionyl-CoA carboxylase alpha subunit